MSRYSKVGEWRDEVALRNLFDPFVVQVADCLDGRNGDRFSNGAFRVIDSRSGKPARKGKGGTVPFYGEMAWADAQRLANDLFWEHRHGQ